MFGGEAGAEAGRLLQRFDEAHLAINDLYNANTTDERISELFAPLRELESLRSRIRGTASLERYDYWLNLIRATRASANVGSAQPTRRESQRGRGDERRRGKAAICP